MQQTLLDFFFRDENSREAKAGFYEFVQKVTISVSNCFHPNRFKVKKVFKMTKKIFLEQKEDKKKSCAMMLIVFFFQ